MNSFTFDFNTIKNFNEAHDDQAVLDFIKFAGFGDQSAVTFANEGIDCDHAQKMPLSQRRFHFELFGQAEIFQFHVFV